jgi:hypothetical protein
MLGIIEIGLIYFCLGAIVAINIQFFKDVDNLFSNFLRSMRD